MKTVELVYGTKEREECEIIPLEHVRNVDELKERFTCNVFVPIRKSRVEFRNGSYLYHPSEEYHRYVAKVKRIR